MPGFYSSDSETLDWAKMRVCLCILPIMKVRILIMGKMKVRTLIMGKMKVDTLIMGKMKVLTLILALSNVSEPPLFYKSQQRVNIKISRIGRHLKN